MRGVFSNSFVQESESCRVAITGLSCFVASAEDLTTFWQRLCQDPEKYTSKAVANGSDNHDDIFLLSKLANAALLDAQADKNTGTKTCIIIGDYYCSEVDLQSRKNRNLNSALQLKSVFNRTEQVECFAEQIKNPLLGLSLAAEKLRSRQYDTVLLLLVESLSSGTNIDSAAALVLKRLLDLDPEKDSAYASLVIAHHETEELQANGDDRQESYIGLKAIYQKAKIQLSSVELLAIGTQSSLLAKSEFTSLALCFAESESEPKKQNWCSVYETNFGETANSRSQIAPLLETILSLQQKVLLAVRSKNRSTKEPLPRPFYINGSMRPWLYPQIHPQFTELNPRMTNYSDSSNVRRAALHYIDHSGTFSHLLFEEHGDKNETKRRDLNPQWDSEIFTFFAASKQQLLQYMDLVRRYLLSDGEQGTLKNLAFTVNDRTKKEIDEALAASGIGSDGKLPAQTDQAIRVAFVATSIEELQEYLTELIAYCSNDDYRGEKNIYFADQTSTAKEISQGKLAFVLPGLGAAYPDMLKEMCLHFPEVRAIFDFVDYLAVSAGVHLSPSNRIFPRRDLDRNLSVETPASLAMMDSAVVTVLMAEWVIFTLLLNLGITPDMLLGCSTGEFAAITMSGAIDILDAAPLFYHLSTGLTKALPFNRLINLRSLKINAAFEDVEQLLSKYKGQIYLSADLSLEQLIVTGEKEAINLLSKSLDENEISADFLPFAIPYHTSLVEDVISLQNPDVQALEIGQPLIESWSCSLANKYPSNSEQIRKISTELFSKPILFRKSIEKLYENGVRKFVEVGPRGSLAPVVSQTLRSSPHISLATNRADCSTLSQLNHTLAVLFINDVYMDLSYLYQRRSPELLPIVDTLSNQTSTIESKPALVTLNTGEQNVVPQWTATVHFQFVQSFQNELRQLERNVISALAAETSKKAGACAVLDRPFTDQSNMDQYIGRKVLLEEIFPHLERNIFAQTTCRLILDQQLPQDDFDLSLFAETILSSTENVIFQSFRHVSKRRQWLAGRLALKESVKSLLSDFYLTKLSNADIEINALESGKIYVHKINNFMQKYPVISLSHKDGQTIAVATNSSVCSAIGIDLESKTVVDEDLAELVLSKEEQNFVPQLNTETQNYALKKIWAAKEAAAKVLGFGLSDWLKNLVITDFSSSRQLFFIRANKWEMNYDSGIIELIAHVASLDNMILAISIKR